MNIPPHWYFLGICFLASLTIYWRKDMPLYLKLFPVFLFLTAIVEVEGLLISKRGDSNILLFNTYSVFEFCFFLYVLRSVMHTAGARRTILGLLIVYPIICVINMLFFQRGGFHSVTYSLGCLLIAVAAMYYFVELFRNPKYSNLAREPAFWICTALLFFYCCTFPLFGMLNFMSNIPPTRLYNIQALLFLVNALLYILFTVAFLCTWRRRNSRRERKEKLAGGHEHA